MSNVVLLLIAFQVKHFFFDFFWQPPYMWQNKGTLGHRGGVDHSLFHALATYGILLYFGIPTVVAYTMFLFEFVAHYFTDWAKMNINRIKGWGATTHNEFWQLTGFDQMIHQLTYIAIIVMTHVA